MTILSDDAEQIVNRRSPGNTLERHASTIGIAIIIGLLLWVGNSILSQSEKQSKMSGDIRVMAKEINYLNTMITAATNNRYTSYDAARDKEIRSRQIESDKAEYNRRFEGIEKRIDHVEDLLDGHK